jgi:hypothetical protein
LGDNVSRSTCDHADGTTAGTDVVGSAAVVETMSGAVVEVAIVEVAIVIVGLVVVASGIAADVMVGTVFVTGAVA